MKWNKLGLVFNPIGERAWMHTHASVPFAERVYGDFYKVYFSTRDVLGRSLIGWVVIDLKKPSKAEEISKFPLLSLGDLGTFDDSGVMGSCLINHQNKKYLYYIGWNLGKTVPFRNSIGLAVSSDDGETYEKFSNGPIIDRNHMEPHFCASCCVRKEGGIFRIWYLSCIGWRLVGGKPQHRYHIKYAESEDGIEWKREGRVAIGLQHPEEYAISVPRVLKDNKTYRMWYSYRGSFYRIGYAVSEDGFNWERMDSSVGICVSETGWDSEMIEYPFVFDHDGELFMFYNGNGYGATGFGIARLES